MRVYLGSSVLLVSLLIGCGPAVVPTQGIVTFEGKPVSGATVMFVPEQGPPAIATTDESGAFDLATSGTQSKGAVASEYKVTVSVAAQIKEDPDVLENGIPKRTEILPSVILPDVYANPRTTPLKATIPADGKLEFKLNAAGS